ncbi:MAG TPA: carotenoid 1,2-hydratase, partial [Hyphomicrobiaceae bacterium]|nr:carotenoid 1,2-hydratase [Hyphomicrobiaceae bacterium]
TFGASGCAEPDRGSDLDTPVASGGYAWWYVDALSDDGRFGLSLIAFVGSVFSPYYAHGRRRGRADPENHVAINIALYGEGGYRWAMTERGRRSLSRTPNLLQIGPSRLLRSGSAWHAQLDEICVPVPRRIRGSFTVEPLAYGRQTYMLDDCGRHMWRPLAPRARMTVMLEDPRLTWSGPAYVDHNRGTEPLEAAFSRWSWSRSVETDRTVIFYDAKMRSGASKEHHIAVGADGAPTPLAAPPMASLGQSLWRLPVEVRTDAGSTPERIATWEDGPFYARTLVRHLVGGTPVTSIHEALSLDRFKRRTVQMLLPFRMPRRS